MVTVREVRRWMSKFRMPDASKVTAKNKISYLDKVLKVAVEKSGGDMDFVRNAKIDIKEDFGMRFKKDMIVLDETKTTIEKKNVAPDVEITRFLERQLKLIQAKPEFPGERGTISLNLPAPYIKSKSKLPKSSQLEFGRESVGLQ
jgi:hypothetical protein